MAGDAGDTKAVQHAQKQYKLRRETDTAYLHEVLSTVAGRAVLWSVLETCGVYRLSYNSNPHEMAFREGHRQVGLKLLAEIQQTKPSAYMQMQHEAQSRESKGGS